MRGVDLSPLSPGDHDYQACNELVRILMKSSNVRTRRVEHVLRLDAALQCRYAGQYVAYVDRWEGSSGARRILLATPSQDAFSKDLQELLASIGPCARSKVVATFVPEPDSPIELNH